MDLLSTTVDRSFVAIDSQNVNMLKAGGGLNLWIFGTFITLKVIGNETGGSYALLEDRVPPGAGPPLHFHTHEDETWYMLEGELIWVVQGKEFHAKAGSFIHLPRFVPHTFSNRFHRTAVMVTTYIPAGFERYFLQVGKEVQGVEGSAIPAEASSEETEKAVRIMKEYDVFIPEKFSAKSSHKHLNAHLSLSLSQNNTIYECQAFL